VRPQKLSTVQQERARIEATVRLCRDLDKVPLATLVRSARVIVAGSKALRSFAVEPTAHERKCALEAEEDDDD
jgi:hypothetical protein